MRRGGSHCHAATRFLSDNVFNVGQKLVHGTSIGDEQAVPPADEDNVS